MSNHLLSPVRAVCLLFLFQLGFACPAHGDLNTPAVLFSDPDHRVVKPQQWIDKPIEYDKWAEGADIAATLDQHLYPAFLPFIQRYAKEHNLDIAMREGTCGTSEGLLNQKRVDMGGFCCPPSLTDRVPGLTFHTIGIASLAILVHPENPVANLSTQQVIDIFSGKLDNWRDIEPAAGKKRLTLPIRPVGRLHCKTRPGHWRSILDNEDQFSSTLLEVGTIPNMITAVADYKGAIGFEVLWNLSRFKTYGKPHTVTINHVSPYDEQAVAQGRYPFYRVDNVTSWNWSGEKAEKIRNLVDFIKENASNVGAVFSLVPSQKLAENGWKFKDDELIGEP
ncbi:MAG: substrate-binding domain-containing protein [Magnetococcales bacterium]|nr:substrate-binding domain-containing protein [Magnetococcales bacterium]